MLFERCIDRAVSLDWRRNLELFYFLTINYTIFYMKILQKFTLKAYCSTLFFMAMLAIFVIDMT